MNILSKLPIYAGKWKEAAVENIDAADIAAIREAVVVESQFGLSVCMYLHAGGQTYLPLDTNSSLGVGEIVDLTKAKIVTLRRAGDDDIYRIRI